MVVENAIFVCMYISFCVSEYARIIIRVYTCYSWLSAEEQVKTAGRVKEQLQYEKIHQNDTKNINISIGYEKISKKKKNMKK